jgi:hypothetical protein
MRFKAILVAAVAETLVLPGCGTTSQDSSGQGSGSGGVVAWALGGAIGASVGAVAAEALARSEGRRLHLSEAEIQKRKRGYIIAFALVGGVGGAVLAGSVFGKLQASGKEQRARALQAAADQAHPQQYGEPADPSLSGTVTPGPRYTEVASNRECVDVEDTLKDASKSDDIFVKMCRTPPSGEWQQTTT